MKLGHRARRAATGLLLALLALLSLLVVPGAASAAPPTTSPFDPALNGATQGTLFFTDAAGNPVYSGNASTPPAFVKALTDVGRPTDVLASVFIYTPVEGQNAITWNPTQISSGQIYRADASTPGTAQASPFIWVADHAADFPNPAGATSPYRDLYAVRILTSGPGASADSSRYASATISYDTVTGQWAQVFPTPPAAATATTTTLAVSPASPQVQGTSVTLTATVSPTAAGTVQFRDGTTAVGAPVAVSGSTATTSTSALPVGTRSLTAEFVPTDPAAFTGSTSATTSYVITAPPATVTSTSLAITPPGPVTAGDPVTLTATLSPSAAAGSVQFRDGSSDLGAPVTVASGTASLTTSSLAVGTRSITAVFTPTDAAAFAPSTSPAQTLVVQPAPGAPTTTTLTVPAGPVTAGDDVTLTATVDPSTAGGSVQFLDGGVALGGPQALTAGSASLTTNLLPVGTRTLTAQFQPADSAVFAPSTSAPRTLVVQAPATTTTLAVSPTGPVVQGDPVTLTATVTPGSAAGSVQFRDGSTALGAPVPVASGSAVSTVTTLPVGTRSLTAEFIPANTDAFRGSTSAPVTLVVDAPPPATETTTTLAVSPAGPVTRGDAVTLTATVAPAGAVGTVQFLDGGAALGTPQTLAGGTASLTTTDLAAGTRSLTASFVPADATDFTASQSAPQTLVVERPPAVDTATALVVSPAGPVVAGSPVTLTATVSPDAAAVGTVQFRDGTTALGAPQPVSGGTATLTTSSLAVGSRSLTAEFVPADALEANGSTSAARSLEVLAPPTVTTTALAVTPSGGNVLGDEVTLTATVAPGAAVGAVQFRDGTTALGAPVPVEAGQATLTLSTLPVGTRSLTAEFVPTTSADFAGSTSPAVPLEIGKTPVDVTGTSGGAPITEDTVLAPGASVTVSGEGFEPGEDVTLRLGTGEVLATVQAAEDGTASATGVLPAVLAAGENALFLEGALARGGLPFIVAAAAPAAGGGGPAAVPTGTGGGGGTRSTTTGGSGSGAGGSSLPLTGAPVLVLALLGAAATATGGGLLAATRRRRGTEV